MIPEGSTEFDITKSPEDGSYNYGLFLDGARWDDQNRCLNESLPKILQYKVPYILFLPTEEKKDYDNDNTVPYINLFYRFMNALYTRHQCVGVNFLQLVIRQTLLFLSTFQYHPVIHQHIGLNEV